VEKVNATFRIDQSFLRVYFGTLLLSCAIPWTITVLVFWALLGGGMPWLAWLGWILTADDLALLCLTSLLPCGAIWLIVGRFALQSGLDFRSAVNWASFAMAVSGTMIFTVQRGLMEGTRRFGGFAFSSDQLLALFLLPFALFSSSIMVQRVFGKPDAATSIE
jgi:hypothetical protein